MTVCFEDQQSAKRGKKVNARAGHSFPSALGCWPMRITLQHCLVSARLLYPLPLPQQHNALSFSHSRMAFQDGLP